MPGPRAAPRGTGRPEAPGIGTSERRPLTAVAVHARGTTSEAPGAGAGAEVRRASPLHRVLRRHRLSASPWRTLGCGHRAAPLGRTQLVGIAPPPCRALRRVPVALRPSPSGAGEAVVVVRLTQPKPPCTSPGCVGSAVDPNRWRASTCRFRSRSPCRRAEPYPAGTRSETSGRRTRRMGRECRFSSVEAGRAARSQASGVGFPLLPGSTTRAGRNTSPAAPVQPEALLPDHAQENDLVDWRRRFVDRPPRTCLPVRGQRGRCGGALEGGPDRDHRPAGEAPGRGPGRRERGDGPPID